MRCSKCGVENREGRKFCAQCGSALNLRCSSCGAENTPGEKFCGDCGAALAGTPSSSAQKKPELKPTAPDIRISPEQPLRRCLLQARFILDATRFNAGSKRERIRRRSA